MISDAELLRLKMLCATADNDTVFDFCDELAQRSDQSYLSVYDIEFLASMWSDGEASEHIAKFQQSIALLERMQRLDARQSKQELSELSIG